MARAHEGAAVVLAALVVLSPWPFGSVHWTTIAAITLIGLGVSLVVGLLSLRRGHSLVSPRATAPLAALWALGSLQLVPLPRAVLAVVAPGPAAVWYPANAAAAAVLGPGPRPISIYPEATIRWLTFSAAAVGLALVAGPALRSRRVLLRVAVTVTLGGALVAGYGLVARLVFANRLFGVLAVPTVAPFGPFVSKNHFAGYVEMVACLALGLAVGLADEARHGADWLSWLESRRAGWIVAAFGVAALLVLAVPVSLSRGGVVSLAAGLVAFALVRVSTRDGDRSPSPIQGSAPVVRPRSTLVWTALVLVAVAAATAAVLPEEARARVRTMGHLDQAGSYRLSTWRDSLRLAASSPVVGSGLGAFADALPRFKSAAEDLRIEHAENDYLELLGETGLAGAALAALALAWAAAGAWRRIAAEPHRLSRGLRAGALAGLAALLVHSAVDFNLRIPSNALLAVLLLACALAPTGEETDAPTPCRWQSYACLALATAAVALALSGPWRDRALDARLLERATLRSGLRAGSLESAAVAQLAHRPADAPAWLALAWLRAGSSQAGAADLARWALQLDPLHPALRRAAAALTASGRGAASSPPAATSSRASGEPRSGG